MNASGVSIAQSVADEYVLMRLAQMLQEGSVSAALERALGSGNTGGESLKVMAMRMRAFIADASKA